MVDQVGINSQLCLAFVGDKATESILNDVQLKHLDFKMEVHIGGVKEATQYFKSNRSPRILILDVANSELPLSDIYALGEACEPGVDVIVIGSKNDVGLFRQLLQIGVRDYIVKPVSENLLQKSIEAIVQAHPTAMPGKLNTKNKAFSNIGKTVAFVGVRGGVGTTTLAANSSWLLAEKFAKRTSIIDLDVQQGIISHLFDINTSSNFKEVLETPELIDDIFTERVMVKKSEHLYVLSSEDSLTEAYKTSEKALPLLLNYLLSHFQYTLFDIPRNYLLPTTLQLLKQADIVVIVVDYNIISARDTVRLLKYLRDAHNPAQRIILVANNVGQYRKGELEQSVFEDSIKTKINLNIRFDANIPLEALNQGVPATSFAGALADDIGALATMILDKDLNHEQQKSSSIVNRLFAKLRDD